ncbi:hypothetical protein AGLY_014832 [Aphis glycines]|uniref:Uncharacterized protein n=1 Tax=Aphis glycines TaxID=307491 RepID=A0A6G0T2P9_APHGL|nr:hypothetical protein AGLY_014832 [Aphis glycines]
MTRWTTYYNLKKLLTFGLSNIKENLKVTIIVEDQDFQEEKLYTYQLHTDDFFFLSLRRCNANKISNHNNYHYKKAQEETHYFHPLKKKKKNTSNKVYLNFTRMFNLILHENIYIKMFKGQQNAQDTYDTLYKNHYLNYFCSNNNIPKTTTNKTGLNSSTPLIKSEYIFKKRDTIFCYVKKKKELNRDYPGPTTMAGDDAVLCVVGVGTGCVCHLPSRNVLLVFLLVVCLSTSAVIISDEGDVIVTVCFEALAALVLVGVEGAFFSFFSIVLLGVDLSQDFPAHVLLGGCVLRLERRVGDERVLLVVTADFLAPSESIGASQSVLLSSESIRFLFFNLTEGKSPSVSEEETRCGSVGSKTSSISNLGETGGESSLIFSGLEYVYRAGVTRNG